jgi:hypothetical protein
MSSTNVVDTETRIAVASRVFGKATATLYKTDPEIAERATKVLGELMERVRREVKP